MAGNYRTPGVYIEEIPKFPPSVAQVETAIPAFVGYTQKAEKDGVGLTKIPTRIKSLLEYEAYFGTMDSETVAITIKEVLDGSKVKSRTVSASVSSPNKNTLYYHMQLYFANGGGPCYIVSVGKAANAVTKTDLDDGVKEVAKFDEPTLIVVPEAVGLTQAADAYNVYKTALAQAALLMDRFVVIDCHGDNPSTLRDATNGIGADNLKYGAAYHPYMVSGLNYQYADASVTIAHQTDTNGDGTFEGTGDLDTDKLDTVAKNSEYYALIKAEIAKLKVTLPPSASIAGVYARVDNERGVWKAPANVGVMNINGLTKYLTDADQADLNVDPDGGKSINCLRAITGRGLVVWGARTLAGNDNEWRYVSVRRFFNMVEESVKKASVQFVFEPNDANTWTKVRAMISNYLFLLWRQGALAGAKPEHAFYVYCGLGTTMTAEDILEGRMNVEIGMAAVRPAEFIILKFSHKMQES